MSVAVALMLIVLGRSGFVPKVIEKEGQPLHILIIVLLILVVFILLAIQYGEPGRGRSFLRWLGAASVFCAAGGLIFYGVDLNSWRFALGGLALLFVSLGLYLGWLVGPVYPVRWSLMWQWLNSLSTAALLSAAFVFVVTDNDARAKPMMETWAYVFALSTTMLIGLFVSLRGGIFIGRLASLKFSKARR